jgi:Ca-activated chloride channel homolog
MKAHTLHSAFFGAPLFCAILLCANTALAQGPLPPGGFSAPGGNVPFDTSRLNMTMLAKDAEKDLSPLSNPALSVSKLDLKAPGKARHEYDKGIQSLNRKDYQNAVSHLSAAITIYGNFVAAHNGLGSSYLGLNENDQAREEFIKAVALDDHLPISHLNLSCAELALKNFAAAESAMKTAASIAPMDMQVLTALTYAELMNHDYDAAISTAKEVHGRKHKDAAIVHFYAANAWYGQANLKEAQNELQELLSEDPKSPAADQARSTLAQIKNEERQVPVVLPSATSAAVFSDVAANDAHLAPGQVPTQMQKVLQESKEKQQIAEAESLCTGCDSDAQNTAAAAGQSRDSKAAIKQPTHEDKGYVLRTSVDEVALLFAATDHGDSVTDLTRSDVSIRDDRQAPASITGFLSESELPLRLGVVIDTSESITSRFGFEQKAAIDFVDKVVTNKDDLAFVVGVANSVLLVQDFTADRTQLSKGIDQLAPAGGTALWDAVTFASAKLASRIETRPVARVLVVISDGEDNSSSTTIKEAIESAEHSEVIVYTVSTRDERDTANAFYKSYATNYFVGDRALKVLAEGTGGTPFFPGSLSHLNHSLADLQQIIRGRYLISYKPSEFQRNGHYRSVDITAHKSGHKLRVYARKGYYAKLDTTADNKL